MAVPYGSFGTGSIQTEFGEIKVVSKERKNKSMNQRDVVRADAAAA
jgi:hypothetical protein